MLTIDRMLKLTSSIQLIRHLGEDDDEMIMEEYNDICRELEICDILGCEGKATEPPWCREHHPWKDEEY